MAEVARRSVLIGAAAAPLAACGGPTGGPTGTAPTAGQQLATVGDVGVGSATIVDGTLITQPTPGVFKGFAARCTHAGCALAVKNGGIECPCHGSRFTLDGAVERGPAVEPLAPRAIRVSDGHVVAG